jgi:uncharacterized protein (DUF58 family)
VSTASVWVTDDQLYRALVRRFLIGAGGVAVLAALLQQPLLLIISLIMVLIAGGIALFWNYCFSGVSYRREVSRTRAFWGEDVEITLIAENAKPMPLLRLDVIEEVSQKVRIPNVRLDFADKIDTRHFPVFFSLGIYERVKLRYTVPGMMRGRYRIGPGVMTTSDPFGLITRDKQIPGSVHFIVYPRMVPLSGVPIPARQPLGDFKPSQPLVEDPLRIQGVRPYVAGDSPRRIHWRATARTGQMQTRVYETSATPSAALFLDTNTFAYLWEGQNTALLELAITLTASLARDLILARHQVGLFANAPILGGPRTIRVLPGRHPAQLTRMLENLAMLVPAFGDRIEQMVVAEIPRLSWGTTIVIITCNVTDSLQRSLQRLIRNGAGRFVLIAVGEKPDLLPELQRRLICYYLPEEEAWDVVERLTLERIH